MWQIRFGPIHRGGQTEIALRENLFACYQFTISRLACYKRSVVMANFRRHGGI
jgi:hypothetical protein